MYAAFVLAQGTDVKTAALISRLNKMSPDTAKVSALLKVSSYYVNKPGSFSGDMQMSSEFATQAVNLSQHLKTDDGLARCYIVFSQICREQGKDEQGKAYISKAIKLLQNQSSPRNTAQAYFELASYYNIDKSIVEKIAAYRKGLACLERSSPPPVVLADALKFMGDLYQYNRQFTEAFSSLQQALTLYQKAGVKKLQDIYTLIGAVYIETDKVEEGIRYNLLAARAVEETRDSSMTACEIYNNLGIAYDHLRDIPNGALYFQKARAIAQKNRDTGAVQNISANLSGNYNALGEYQKALKIMKEAYALGRVKNLEVSILLAEESLKSYTALKQYDLARPYYEQLLQVFKDKPDMRLFNAHAHVIQYLLATRQYQQLDLQMSMLADTMVKKLRLPEKIALERLAFQADSSRQRYMSAMHHHESLMHLSVEQLKKVYDKQVAGLQVQFEIKSKDQDIAFKAKHIDLLTRKNQLQNAALKSQQLVRDLSLASAGLLALLLGISYNRYQIKKKNNQELQSQQLAINSQNESLRQLLTERDWLIKEIHHRVKNNLQIVISLLNSQLVNIKDAVAKDVIRESQHRMHSISLIHQRLYQHDNLSGINIHEYITELTGYLRDSFDASRRIEFLIEADRVMLDVSQAVSLGLIINEAVTNAIKHAFLEKQERGSIRISAKADDTDQIILSIGDNGRGLPENFLPKSASSLGMKLITGLTRQLKGKVDFLSSNGLEVIVSAPLASVLSVRKAREEFAVA
jgi:two-component sensor histidine kinase